MENTGGSILNGQTIRPSLGVVSFNRGYVEVLAQNITQTVSSNHARMGIGAGFNFGTVRAMAQNTTQNGLASFVSIGVGAGINDGTGRVQGIAQGITQIIPQSPFGMWGYLGVGAGINRVNGTAQGVAQDISQTALRNPAYIGIGAGSNLGTAQGVAQTVTQSTGYTAAVGIGAGKNQGTAQGVAQDVTRILEGNAQTGVGAGSNTGTAEGKLLTSNNKAISLTGLGLTVRQQDWVTSNTTFPMLRGMDGGYQDMQRLSLEFRQAMKDYAQPSNNPDASWFSSSIQSILFPRLATTTETVTTPPTTTEIVTTPPAPGNCPVPTGYPVYQAYDNENQWLYIVALKNDLSTDFMVIRYSNEGVGVELDEGYGHCGVRMFNTAEDIAGYAVTNGIFYQKAGEAHIRLFVSEQPAMNDVYSLDLNLVAGTTPDQLGACPRITLFGKIRGSSLFAVDLSLLSDP